MLGFSWGELILVAIVMIIFTDPKDLPEFTRKAARAIKKLKSFTREFTDVINKELTEPKTYIKDLKGEMKPTYDISDLQKPVIPTKAGISAEKPSETSSKDSRLRGNDS